MRRVIRDAADLPGWFNLDSYGPQRELSLSGWLRQLAVRAELLGAPRPWCQRELSILDEMQRQPIVPPDAVFVELNSWVNDLEGQCEGDARGQPPARPMVIRDLLALEDTLGHAALDKARDLRRRIYYVPGFPIPNVPDAIEAMKEEHLLDEPIADCDSTSTYLSLDLGLPDEVVVAAVRELLPSLRRARARSADAAKPTVARIDPTGWTKFAVLPYIDLLMWSERADVRVPNRVIADAIFPPGEGGEEVVRKTTSKVAAAVMTDVVLRQLVSAALAQIRNA